MGKARTHQPEPWIQDGCEVRSSGRKKLATAAYPADARRIVAAVNSLAGLPTAVLESGAVKDLLATLILATDPDLEAARRWLRAAGRERAPRKRDLAFGPKQWPVAARRVAAALRAVEGIRTSVLERDALRKLLQAVAASRESDVRVAGRWLGAISKKSRA